MSDSEGAVTPDVLIDRAQRPFARLLFAHGAGAPMDSDFMNEVAAELARRGVEVVRFEFPYMAARRLDGKRRPPNRADVLLACWDEMVQRYAQPPLPLFIGGKSMGGRMASVWGADNAGEICRGVVCLGYPFHPAGKPDTLRIAHLPRCPVPLLIIQGERDPLGNRGEVASYELGGSAELYWLPAADHDLKPLRSSGHSHQQHMAAAAKKVVSFMRGVINFSTP